MGWHIESLILGGGITVAPDRAASYGFGLLKQAWEPWQS
jgi:hypothetical protein